MEVSPPSMLVFLPGHSGACCPPPHLSPIPRPTPMPGGRGRRGEGSGAQGWKEALHSQLQQSISWPRGHRQGHLPWLHDRAARD